VSLLDVLGALRLAVADEAAFAVVGALARNAWAPPRATTDIDLAVAASPDVLLAIQAALLPLGYARVREQRADANDPLPDIVIFRSDQAVPRQVDLLVTKTAFEVQALGRALAVDVSGATVRVVTPEDLVVYKLIAGRPRDRDDVRAVARTQARMGRPLDWSHVERWAAYWGVSDRAAALRRDLEE
jgi:predicted nucleotidyltransferase